MDKVRLGVLGAGNIAAMNVRGYLEDPRCDIVAVCDTDEEIGRQAAKEWGAESFYADLADLLADDSIDAVEILTPDPPAPRPRDRRARGRQARVGPEAGGQLGRGRPGDGRRWRTGWAARCASASASSTTRRSSWPSAWSPKAPSASRRRCASAPWSARPTRPSRPSLRPEGYGWRLDKRSPGGHLFDDMVHKYAMALWLLDMDITSVQAVVRRRDLFFEPCAVIFEYEDPDVLGIDGGPVRARTSTCAPRTTAPTSSSRSPATRGSSG